MKPAPSERLEINNIKIKHTTGSANTNVSEGGKNSTVDRTTGSQVHLKTGPLGHESALNAADGEFNAERGRESPTT